MIIEKNTILDEAEFHEYPYYIATIKRLYITTIRQWFRVHYPNHRFLVEELDNANSIHAFNRFQKECHVERAQYRFGLFDLVRDVLYALGTPETQD